MAFSDVMLSEKIFLLFASSSFRILFSRFESAQADIKFLQNLLVPQL